MVNHWFSQLYFNLYQLYVFSAFQIRMLYMYIVCDLGALNLRYDRSIWFWSIGRFEWMILNVMLWTDFLWTAKIHLKSHELNTKPFSQLFGLGRRIENTWQNQTIFFYCCCCWFDLNFYVTNSTGECTRYRWIWMLLHRTLDWIEISRHRQTRYVQCQQRLK